MQGGLAVGGTDVSTRVPVRSKRLVDLRDQLGLRAGWIRLWLRGIGLGFGIMFLGVSFGLWKVLAPAAIPVFLLGIAVIPVTGLLALVTWVLPAAWVERRAQCPACGHEEVLLRLPWRTAHTCRHCLRQGYAVRGEMHLGTGGP